VLGLYSDLAVRDLRLELFGRLNQNETAMMPGTSLSQGTDYSDVYLFFSGTSRHYAFNSHMGEISGSYGGQYEDGYLLSR
jgi:hypothetical protein